jgi:hypothetical protein
MKEYKHLLKMGVIQRAYKGLMDYIMGLRTHFNTRYPDYFVSSSLYYGYMDMTYFSIVPKIIAERKLKVAIVFLHEACRFEIWLAGANKQVQSRYWKCIKESGWEKYHLVPTTKGEDAIIQTILVDQPDFDDPDGLTKQIEYGTNEFINDVEEFLNK